MAVSHARASRIASSCPKDFDFQHFLYQNEGNYPIWMTTERILNWVYSLPESVLWNGFVCLVSMSALLLLSAEIVIPDTLVTVPLSQWVDHVYNAVYSLHTAAHLYYDCYRISRQEIPFRCTYLLRYGMDVCSYSHYVTRFIVDKDIQDIIQIGCYYMRLQRPLIFLWALMEYNLRGDVFEMLLKYMYIFTIVRIILVNFFIWIGAVDVNAAQFKRVPVWFSNRTKLFFRGFYSIDTFFTSLGTEIPCTGTRDRIYCISEMLFGCLAVAGITIASMALIVGLHMRPEEIFRSRLRIIINDMKLSHVPQLLRKKVETFYQMFWHKQKAVSRTHLMTLFPPTLTNAINTDIYFEAQQKSRILCDLSYQFLSEIARCMETINYVPGDTIISRKSPKCTMVYISYGDVEVLSAEDDDTAMLRLTRGSALSPCGGCAEVAGGAAHAAVRAATFCTAHALSAADLWRVAAKYGKANGQSFILHSSFEEHFEKVKRHYACRFHPPVKYKSSILMLKRNLIELKEARNADGTLLLSRDDMFLEIAGCYVMRNEANSTLTEESDGICLRLTFPCILQPMSSLLTAWHIVVAVLAIAVFFVHPYQLVYLGTIKTTFKFFDYMISVIFIVDIIVHLSIGDKMEEGVPVTFTHTSAKQMMSIWFVVDVLSVMPIFEFVGDGRFTGINKLLKLATVFRLLKQMEPVYLDISNWLRAAAYVLFVVSAYYLLAAVKQYIMCFTYNLCVAKNISVAPFWGFNPKNRTRYLPGDDPPLGRILLSWYWAISFMNSTCSKVASLLVNVYQIQVVYLVMMEVCIVMRTLLDAAFSATIMCSMHMRDQYNTCIETVNNFLEKSNVDPILRTRLTEYLKLCWFTDKAYSITHEKKSILFDLPVHVYQEIMALQRSKYLLCIPCMKTLHKEVLKTLSAHARLFYTSPNEILQNTGEISNEIYVIRQGMCEVIDPITKKVATTIGSKVYFGDVECIMRLPSFYTIRAVTHVQMFSISRKYFAKVILTPRIIDAMRFAKQQPQFSQLQRRRESFLRYEPPPPPPHREMFPLPRKYEADAAFLQPFTRLGFLAVLRYIFPRFTIRPDGKYLKRCEYFRAACAILSSLLYPFYGMLVLQWPRLSHVSTFLDICAYLDIIQRMLVGYFDERGILVYHPVSTAAHYIRGAFLVDLLVSLPLCYLDSTRNVIFYESKFHAYRHPKEGQFLMLNRLGQLYRVPPALDILADYTARRDVILLIKSLPFFLCLISVVASCIAESTIYKYKGLTSGYAVVPRTTPQWVIQFSDQVDYNITESAWNVVLTTYYWVTYEVTTVGFNIFQPTRYQALGYLIIGMVIGYMMTTYISVSVLSIRSNVNQALATFQGHIKDINIFMNRENISQELRNEVISYYEYKWDKTGGTDYRAVLKLCDQITLRTDTILHIYGQTFSKCPLLFKCDVSLLRILGREMHSVYYRDGITVLERDEVIGELFIVDYGTVEMRHPRDDSHIVTKLPRGSVFGNLNNVDTAVNPNRFVASANLHLLKINTIVFYKVIADFPSIKVLLLKFRPHEENFIIGSVREQSVVVSAWKERALSSPLVAVSQKGMLKYLHVHSKLVQIYLIAVSLLCVYGDTYNAGFQDNRLILLGVLYLLDFCFLFKIVLNCAMPFVTDEQSESRVALESSRKIYFKGEFRYDLLSILPLELFCLLKPDPWSLFAFLRLNRTIRVTTVYNSLRRYHQKLFINLSLTTILSVLVWFTLLLHGATCVWFHLSIIEEDKRRHSSWRYRAEKTSLRSDGLIHLCENTTYYICSMYFVYSTFTQNGIGDILPRQTSEVLFVIILMVCSTMLYMLYVGEFSNIIQYQSFRTFAFYSQFLELTNFLEANRVSENLITMTKKYTLYLWRESRGLQVPTFLREAPRCLRLKVMAAAYMDHFREHPTFQFCEPAFLRHLVGHLQPFLYLEDMWVVKEGEITNAMYIVHRGRVQELDEDMERDIQVFYPGQVFGTPHGLFKDIPYALSYKTIIKSQILTLTLKDWEFLLQHFPKSRDIIYKDQGKDKDFSNFMQNGDDDKGDKEKKRVQITKAPTVHPLKGAPSILQVDDDPKKTTKPKVPVPAAGAISFAGIPSGRDSDTPPVKVSKEPENFSEKVLEPLWPMDNRSNSEEENIQPEYAKFGESFPKQRQNYARRKSTVHGVDKAAVAEELQHIGSSFEVSLEKKVDEVTSKPFDTKDKNLSRIISTQENSPWPLDSRHDMRISQELERSFVRTEATPSYEAIEKNRMSADSRRGSSIKERGSAIEGVNDSRRQSSVDKSFSEDRKPVTSSPINARTTQGSKLQTELKPQTLRKSERLSKLPTLIKHQLSKDDKRRSFIDEPLTENENIEDAEPQAELEPRTSKPSDRLSELTTLIENPMVKDDKQIFSIDEPTEDESKRILENTNIPQVSKRKAELRPRTSRLSDSLAELPTLIEHTLVKDDNITKINSIDEPPTKDKGKRISSLQNVNIPEDSQPTEEFRVRTSRLSDKLSKFPAAMKLQSVKDIHKAADSKTLQKRRESADARRKLSSVKDPELRKSITEDITRTARDRKSNSSQNEPIRESTKNVKVSESNTITPPLAPEASENFLELGVSSLTEKDGKNITSPLLMSDFQTSSTPTEKVRKFSSNELSKQSEQNEKLSSGHDIQLKKISIKNIDNESDKYQKKTSIAVKPEGDAGIVASQLPLSRSSSPIINPSPLSSAHNAYISSEKLKSARFSLEILQRTSTEEIELQKINYSDDDTKKLSLKRRDSESTSDQDFKGNGGSAVVPKVKPKEDDQEHEEKTKRPILKSVAINLNTASRSIESRESNQSSDEDLQSRESKDRSPNLRRKSFVQKVKGYMSGPDEDFEDDNFLLEQDEKNTEELLEKLAAKQPPTNPTNFSLEPVVRSDIYLETFQDPKEKRSALSFRDEIITVEIPKDDQFSVSDYKEDDKDESELQSILSFVDDITLKELKPPQDTQSVTSVQYAPDEESATSLATKSKSSSMFDVEQYMMDEKKSKASDKKVSRTDDKADNTRNLTKTRTKSTASLKDVEDYLNEEKAAKSSGARHRRRDPPKE